MAQQIPRFKTGKKVHTLHLEDSELFALNCLVNLAVQINWNGPNGQPVDTDTLELRFRAGKISLKEKVAAIVKAAEPEGAVVNGDA